MESLAILFIVPAVCYGLLYFGVWTYGKMYRARWRSWAALLIAAAFITPTGDIFSLLFLTLPLIVEFEIILFTARLREGSPRRLRVQEK